MDLSDKWMFKIGLQRHVKIAMDKAIAHVERNPHLDLGDVLKADVKMETQRFITQERLKKQSFGGYNPGGMAMPNRNIVGDYRYGYQGEYSEKDEETGLNAFQLRMYDSRINRWISPDPYGQFHSPYMSMGNNWTGFVDPDGGLCQDAQGNSIPCPDGYGAFNDISDIGVFDNGEFQEYGLQEVIINSNGNQLDPSTVGQNLFGLTYPGGDNPLTFNGDYTYTAIPEDLSEYPAIGHDRRYDNLGVAGASGLFTDTRAIGADYKFVSEELQIASNPFLPIKTRLYAGTLGVGLGLAALPKTLYKFATSFGYPYNKAVLDISVNYHISNHGVTNAPDKQ